MNTNATTQQLFKATIAHFVSQKEKALATLHLYLTNSVAIGDHPNVIEEIIKLTKQLSEAEECLAVLNKSFISAQAPQPQDPSDINSD